MCGIEGYAQCVVGAGGAGAPAYDPSTEGHAAPAYQAVEPAALPEPSSGRADAGETTSSYAGLSQMLGALLTGAAALVRAEAEAAPQLVAQVTSGNTATGTLLKSARAATAVDVGLFAGMAVVGGGPFLYYLDLLPEASASDQAAQPLAMPAPVATDTNLRPERCISEALKAKLDRYYAAFEGDVALSSPRYQSIVGENRLEVRERQQALDAPDAGWREVRDLAVAESGLRSVESMQRVKVVEHLMLRYDLVEAILADPACRDNKDAQRLRDFQNEIDHQLRELNATWSKAQSDVYKHVNSSEFDPQGDTYRQLLAAEEAACAAFETTAANLHQQMMQRIGQLIVP